MRLAIVGSRSLADSPEARSLVHRLIVEAARIYRPLELISGGSIGIDTIVSEEAKRLGIPITIFWPEGIGWTLGYKPRNILIAKRCDRLIRIAAKPEASYGSGWTRDYAAKLGKHVEEYEIASQP